MEGRRRRSPASKWIGGCLLVASAVLMPFTACDGIRREQTAPTVIEHVLQDADLTGWKLVGEPTLYDASSLYERVNGEDGLYLSAGFTRLTSIELEEDRRRGVTVVADVYELGSTLSAFGIYSRLHEEEAVIPGLGTSACLFGALVVMYKDRYLVRINADPSVVASDQLKQVLTGLAEKVAGGIPGSEGPPCELGFLPEVGLDAGTVTYVENSLHGHDFLPGGLRADYLIGDRRVGVFLTIFPDAEAATAALHRYNEILQETGGPSLLAEVPEWLSVAGREPDSTRVSLAVRDRLLVGARGHERTRDADELLRSTIRAIEDNVACSPKGNHGSTDKNRSASP